MVTAQPCFGHPDRMAAHWRRCRRAHGGAVHLPRPRQPHEGNLDQVARQDVADVRVREAGARRNDQVLAETVVEHVAPPGRPRNLRRVRPRQRPLVWLSRPRSVSCRPRSSEPWPSSGSSSASGASSSRSPSAARFIATVAVKDLVDRADGEGRIPADRVARPVLQLTDLDRHGLAAVVVGELRSGDPVSLCELRERVPQGVSRDGRGRG